MVFNLRICAFLEIEDDKDSRFATLDELPKGKKNINFVKITHLFIELYVVFE